MKVMNQQISNLTLQYDDYFARGLYSNALEVANKILEEANVSSRNEDLVIAYMKLIHCYYSLGEVENAFEVIIRFRILCESLKANKKIEYYLHMINGYIYDYEENYKEAAKCFHKSLMLANEINEHRPIAFSRNIYAHILLKDGQYETAYDNAMISYNYIQEHLPSNLLLVCHSQHILATTQIETNRLDDAYQLLEQLSKNPIILYNKKERSRYLFATATYYLKKKQYDEAISFFKKSEEIAFQTNDQLVLKRIYKYYGFIYAQMEDYKLAYIQMQNYAHLLENTIKLKFSSKVKELDYKQSAFNSERRANIDALSGLYNRSYLEQTVNQWLATAKQEKTHICIAVFDVDNFKTINDTYGHLYGDEVIKHIGKCCNDVFPKGNVLSARYGGDEFVISLRNFGREHIREATMKLFTTITETPITHEDVSFNISISMGVVCNDSFPAKRFTQLFRVADQALYSAKKQGKNQIIAMSNHSCPLQ